MGENIVWSRLVHLKIYKKQVSDDGYLLFFC